MYIIAAIGILCGYAIGRWLWLHRRTVLPFWPIIGGLAAASLVLVAASRALGVPGLWNQIGFPFLVGVAAGWAITPARPPRQGLWWQVWR